MLDQYIATSWECFKLTTVLICHDNDDQVINTLNDSMTTFLAPLLATIFLS